MKEFAGYTDEIKAKTYALGIPAGGGARTRNNLHVGIHVSTNCAISGAILPLGVETRGIIERRAVPRKRVAVVRRMLQRAHIRGVSLVGARRALAGKRITVLVERVAARRCAAASSLAEIRCARGLNKGTPGSRRKASAKTGAEQPLLSRRDARWIRTE